MNIAKAIKIKDGEAVVRVVRRYWLTLLPHILLAVLLVYAPFFFMVPLLTFGKWGLVILGGTVGIGFLFTLRLAILWRWNAFVVTTHRIVDIDQRGFFDRVVSEAPYDRIQDVSYRVRGPLGHLFGYGTVSLQTAGNAVMLELKGVSDPREVHHLITEQMHHRATRSEGGIRSAKVAQLLESAGDMTDAEARAFVMALQDAMEHPRTKGWTAKEVEDLYKDDDRDGETGRVS